MQNYIQKGDVLEVAAPADVEAGEGIAIGEFVGVCLGKALDGELVRIQLSGVVELPKKAADTFAVGAPAYWDATEKELTSTATDNTLAGHAFAAAAGADATAIIKLKG